MTRAGDVLIPDVTPHVFAPDAPLARWAPWRPVIGLELLPQAAYVWDDADPAIVWDADVPGTYVPGYLTPTVGTATTPDPGPLPTQCTLVVKVRGPTTAQGAIVGQYESSGQYSWALHRLNTDGRLNMRTSATGTTLTGNVLVTAGAVTGADELLAASVDLNSAGQQIVTAKRSTDGGATWATAGTGQRATLALFDSSTVMRIGADAAANKWNGRIYSVELRTGLDPAAGTVVWRFDADDYPGTGTSYVDPRGRTWTLSVAGAITPKVPGTPLYVWDAPMIGGGFTDAACDFVTLDVDPGEPDELYLFPAVSATLTLANPDGAYTPWSTDGRLVYWAPGRRFVAYWRNVDTGEERWMFSGRVASWTVNADGTVTVVAYDGLAALAQAIGPWTPGAAGDTPRARIVAIAATAQYPDPIVTDVGAVTLSTGSTTNAPLEMIETAALSDGGLFYGDADGSLVYRDRLWRAGRLDQPQVWTVSDNVCTAQVIVWEPSMAADDERLATVVRLANAAQPALIATATADASLWSGGARFVLTHPDPDQWQTQGQGDTLAAYLVAQQSTPSMALEGFDLYGLDPQQPAVADFTTDLRRGDRVNVLHEFVDADGLPGMLDTTSIALAIAHNLTPETWVSHVVLSRTVDYRTVELWDRTVYVWDQVDPNNVWRY